MGSELEPWAAVLLPLSSQVWWPPVTVEIDFMKHDQCDAPHVMGCLFFLPFTLCSGSQATFPRSPPAQVCHQVSTQSAVLINGKRNCLASNSLPQVCMPVSPCLYPSWWGYLTRFSNLVHMLVFPTYYTDFVIEENTLNLYFKFNWIWQIFSIYSIPSYSLEFMMGVVTVPCFFFIYFCLCLFIWLI